MLCFSCVLIRTSTERPEVLDKGTVVIGGVTARDIEQAVELSRAMKLDQASTAPVTDYQDDCVSTKVVKIIQSYTKIINQVVWNK